jgi:hypothetical protein
MNGRLREAFEAELRASVTAEADGAAFPAWSHLERAHILSQAFPGPHVRVHVAMLGYAWRHRWWGELIGQIPRIILAGPGSAVGRAPLGNTGGSNMPVSAPTHPSGPAGAARHAVAGRNPRPGP